MSIGVRLESLGLPLREAIPQAAALGVAGVMFDAIGELAPAQLSQTGRRHLRHLIGSHSLRLLALGFPTRRGYDVIDKLEARVNASGAALLMAHELGAPFVVNQIGTIPAKRDDKTNAHFFEAMTQVGNEAIRVARFAIHTGGDSPETVKKFLDAIGNYGLAVNYDPAALMVRGFDYCSGVRSLANHIVGTQIKDAVRTASSISGFREVAVGSGEVDWTEYLASLAEIEYHGPYIISGESADRSIDDVTKAIDLLGRFGV